jgi:hypothetical protein
MYAGVPITAPATVSVDGVADDVLFGARLRPCDCFAAGRLGSVCAGRLPDSAPSA